MIPSLSRFACFLAVLVAMLLAREGPLGLDMVLVPNDVISVFAEELELR